ncbi:hypothetical protein Tco_0217183 [Tanacetum coccineum]
MQTLSEAQGVALRITSDMRVSDENRNWEGSAQKPVIMGVSRDIRGFQGCTARGVGLRVENFHTGKHRDDDFTPLETIRRFLGIIGSRSLSSLEGRPLSQKGGYVMLPKSNQTIYDALDRFVGLYTHSFSLANLRLPLSKFFYDVQEYYHIHVSRLNPFSYAKLTTFSVMCKVYGEKTISNVLPKVKTRIKDWKGRFFYMQDFIVPSDCLELLSKDNRWDKKYFKDKIPPSIHKNHLYQHLSRHPINVRTFSDPILFPAGLKPSWKHGQERPAIFVGGKEIAFKNFMYAEDDEDLSFLFLEPSPGFGTGSPSALINNEPRFYARQVFVDNVVNQRARELLKVVDQMKGECDVLKEREKAWDKECEDLKAKCKAAMADFDNNHGLNLLLQRSSLCLENLVALESKVASLEVEKSRLEAAKATLRQEIDVVKCDRVEVVLKVVPYVATDLVHSDDIAMLVGKLLADPSTSIEALLSKNPKSLHHATLTKTQAPTPSAPSKKATTSSTPALKPLSPPPAICKLPCWC